MRKMLILTAAIALIAGPALAGNDGAGFETADCIEHPSPMPGSTGQIVVPDDYGSIQAAINNAETGNEIFIKDGTYYESVFIGDNPRTTPVENDSDVTHLRIRGESRDGVVLDGWVDSNSNEEMDEGEFRNDGISAFNDYILIENLTARHYEDTAIYWAHQTGYWGRYLTTYNIGRYGIYAYDARCGQLNDSYGGGIGDGAFYVGECYPCDAVITDVVGELSALGYSGTNAGGNLTIRNSEFYDNALGIVPNSLLGERRPPQRGLTVKNNIVRGTRTDVPGVGFAGTYWGAGIVVAGGVGNHIVGNTVEDQMYAGILLTPLPEAGLPDNNPVVWIPSGNTVFGNTLSGNGLADIVQAAGSGAGNCWSDNTDGAGAPAVSEPVLLETVWACGSFTTPPGGSALVEALLAFETIDPEGTRVRADWWDFLESEVPAVDPTGHGDLPSAALNDWLPALF